MNYAIADIHGCAKTLDALLNKLNLTEDCHIYFLGDYIDRGPRSKEVLDIVISLKNKTVLLGNHEDLMLDSLDMYEYQTSIWLNNGGYQTLKSYNNKIKNDHVDFLRNETVLLSRYKDIYLVHAEINQQNPEKTRRETLLWSRGGYFTNDVKFVAGHTPHPLKEIQSSFDKGKIVIDNSCVFKENGYGNLLALNLDTFELTIQKNID